MKFLFEHQQTRVHLRDWAGGDIVAAAFFFWGAGSSELKKSHLGLLRRLLYQVLQERPELIELVLPQRWGAVLNSAAYKKPWTKTELVTAFDLLLQAPETNSKFCLFIDGLDDCEGSHGDLVDAVRALNKSPNVKICVSSRPWSLFQRVYGSNGDACITLHTLAKRDIDTYMASRLEATAPDTYCAEDLRQLRHAVRERSEGVFLWVSLAVKDSRRGIDSHDSMRMLQERLEAYPSELGDFIQRIFQSIDTAYRRFTGRLLLMMLEDTGPPALVSLHFLENSFTADGHHILDTRWTPRTDREMYRLIDRAAVCANKWCRDLIQFVEAREVEKDIYSCINLDVGSQRRSTFHFHTLDEGFEDIISYLSFCHRSIHQFAQEEAGIGTLSHMAGEGSTIAWPGFVSSWNFLDVPLIFSTLSACSSMHRRFCSIVTSINYLRLPKEMTISPMAFGNVSKPLILLVKVSKGLPSTAIGLRLG